MTTFNCPFYETKILIISKPKRRKHKKNTRQPLAKAMIDQSFFNVFLAGMIINAIQPLLKTERCASESTIQLYSSFYLIDNDFEEQPTQSNTQEVNGVIDADGLPPEMPARFVKGNE
jgi:hypothetical protein